MEQTEQASAACAPNVIGFPESNLALALEALNAGYYDQTLAPYEEAYCSENWLNILGLTKDDVPPACEFRPWLMSRVHSDDRPQIAQKYDAFIRGESAAYSVDFRVQHRTGDWIWVQGGVRAVDFDEFGHVRRIVGVMLDITHRKRNEERRELLIKELNHRAKNMLMIVQSLAVQTFDEAADSQTALSSFIERLQSIEVAQNMLSSNQHESIDLRMIAAEIAGRCAKRRIKIEGPTVPLPPAIGVSMAMALNELYTNAVKYGALSVENGFVTLDWHISSGIRPTLTIEWRESGGPPVSPPKRRGFGSRMIERVLSADLDGQVTLDFRPAGLICNVSGPLPSTGVDEIRESGPMNFI